MLKQAVCQNIRIKKLVRRCCAAAESDPDPISATRFVKLLWPIVVTTLKANRRVKLQPNAGARSAALFFRDEKGVKGSDFSPRYSEDTDQSPLGESPLVLAKIKLKKVEQDDNLLCSHPESGKVIEPAMNERLLQCFSKLLTNALRVPGWDIELKRLADPGRDAPVPERVN